MTPSRVLRDDGIVGRFDDGREHLPRSSARRRATSAVRWACLLSRSEFSAAYFSLTSWKTRTTPWMWPSSSLMGAALSAMGRLVPSLAVRTV